MRLTGSLRVPVIRYVLNCILKRKAQIADCIVAARVPKIGRRLATFEGY
jgi:hypothetical protein